MNMKRNINIILLLLTVVLVFATTFNVIKKNEIENTMIDEKEKVKQLQRENENLQNLSDESEENTFEKDVEWFVTKIYTLENRKKLYEEIKDSATDDVLTGLFGDDLPPDENQGEVHSIDRNISDLEVYGKYKDESHYKAIVTLNLTFDHKDKTDNAFTIVQVDLTKKENTWLIDNFEEYAKGGRK